MVKWKRMRELYGLYAKMDLAWLMRDAKFAILAILCDVIGNLSSVTGVFLLAWRFDGIGGMGRYEVLLMLAYSTMVSGVYQTFCSGNNVGHISRRIGRGQMEHMFIQPVSMPLQLMTEGFLPFSGSSNLLSGGILLAIALSNLGLSVPLWWGLSLAGNLLVTTAIMVGISYLSASFTFYAPVQAEEISSYAIDAVGYIGTFPLSGMPLFLQLPLLSLIPAGLMAWFPTLALLGKAPFSLPQCYPLLIAVLVWLVAGYFFKKGLCYYVKKGINRYTAMGHRR